MLFAIAIKGRELYHSTIRKSRLCLSNFCYLFLLCQQTEEYSYWFLLYFSMNSNFSQYKNDKKIRWFLYCSKNYTNSKVYLFQYGDATITNFFNKFLSHKKQQLKIHKIQGMYVLISCFLWL